MPWLALFFAGVLAVVVTTGAVLDKKRVRRSRRVLVWVSLFLLLPFSLIALFLIALFAHGWHSC